MEDQVEGQLTLTDEPVEPWADLRGKPVQAKAERKASKPKPEAAPVIPVAMGVLVRVAPQLVELMVPIDSVKPHPNNLRKHNLDAIAAAIDEYGIMSPVVVQASTMFICKGNGTWKAAKRLGAEQIPASIVELDDETAWRYLLDDNKASDLADYDRAELTKALTSLADAGKLDTTLWTLDELETLQAEQGTLTVLEPQFAGDYAIDAETLAERRNRVVERTGVKMRQTSVILTVQQHETFLRNVEICRKVYETNGVIATVVEAVRREAERIAGSTETQAEPEEEEKTAEELAALV
jgi:hypothetical protein